MEFQFSDLGCRSAVLEWKIACGNIAVASVAFGLWNLFFNSYKKAILSFYFTATFLFLLQTYIHHGLLNGIDPFLFGNFLDILKSLLLHFNLDFVYITFLIFINLLIFNYFFANPTFVVEKNWKIRTGVSTLLLLIGLGVLSLANLNLNLILTEFSLDKLNQFPRCNEFGKGYFLNNLNYFTKSNQIEPSNYNELNIHKLLSTPRKFDLEVLPSVSKPETIIIIKLNSLVDPMMYVPLKKDPIPFLRELFKTTQSGFFVFPALKTNISKHFKSPISNLESELLSGIAIDSKDEIPDFFRLKHLKRGPPYFSSILRSSGFNTTFLYRAEDEVRIPHDTCNILGFDNCIPTSIDAENLLSAGLVRFTKANGPVYEPQFIYAQVQFPKISSDQQMKELIQNSTEFVADIRMDSQGKIEEFSKEIHVIDSNIFSLFSELQKSSKKALILLYLEQPTTLGPFQKDVPQFTDEVRAPFVFWSNERTQISNIEHAPQFLLGQLFIDQSIAIGPHHYFNNRILRQYSKGDLDKSEFLKQNELILYDAVLGDQYFDTKSVDQKFDLISKASGSTAYNKDCNCLEGLDLSFHSGFKMIEVDISWTLDGRPVLLNDWFDSFSSVYNFPPGPVEEEVFLKNKTNMNQQSLNFDYLFKWLEQHKNVRIIPDFKETNVQGLAYIKQKHGSFVNRFIPNVYSFFEYEEALEMGYKDIILNLNFKSYSISEIGNFLKDRKLLAVTVPVEKANAELIETIQKNGAKAYLESVNSIESLQDAIRLGSDGAYTNNLNPKLYEKRLFKQ